MSWLWTKIQTVEGAIIAFMSMVGTFIAFWKFALPGLRKGWKTGTTIANLEEILASIQKEQKEGFERVEEGMRHQIAVRHAMANVYENAVFFSTDENGNFKWLSKMWVRWTGIESHAARGRGWELGLMEIDRPRIIQAWQQAVDHAHAFEAHFSLLNRFTRVQTKVCMIVEPIYAKGGKVVDWVGVMRMDDTSEMHGLDAPSPHHQ